VKLSQIFHNGQPEAKATLLACGGGVGLTKAIEHVGQKIRGDAAPSIVNADLEVLIDSFQNDVHTAILGRELERVREQIPKYLLQTGRVT